MFQFLLEIITVPVRKLVIPKYSLLSSLLQVGFSWWSMVTSASCPFLENGRTRNFALTTTNDHSNKRVIKARRVPVIGITEGATLPTKNIQVLAQVSSWSPCLIQRTHDCGWGLVFSPFRLSKRPLPLDSHSSGPFRLRSQAPCLPSAGLNLGPWWKPDVGKPSSLYYLAVSPCNSMVFYPPLGITGVTTLPTQYAVSLYHRVYLFKSWSSKFILLNLPMFFPNVHVHRWASYLLMRGISFENSQGYSKNFTDAWYLILD